MWHTNKHSKGYEGSSLWHTNKHSNSYEGSSLWHTNQQFKGYEGDLRMEGMKKVDCDTQTNICDRQTNICDRQTNICDTQTNIFLYDAEYGKKMFCSNLVWNSLIFTAVM